MPIIDDEGRLFGYVNVVDALVVLFVLSVLLSGAILVMDSGATTTEPSGEDYATLTIGPLSPDAATTLTEAGTLQIAADETVLNVTDVALTPAPNSDGAFVVVRVENPGESTLLANGQFNVTTNRKAFNATLAGTGNNQTIETRRTAVGIRTNVPQEVAATIEVGDTHRIDSETVATVTDIQRLGDTGGQHELHLTLDLEAIQTRDTPQYATRSVRLGTTLPFRTDRYQLQGEVVSLGPTASERRTLSTQVQATVPETVATEVSSGDEYTYGNRTIADIESVRSYPVAGSNERRLVMQLGVETLVDDETPRFLGTPVRVGATLPFETPSYRFEGTVFGLGESRPGTPTNATMQVTWRNVTPAVSRAIEPGVRETHLGTTVQVTNVQREPATVVLESDGGDIFAREHPVNEDVTLTLDVASRQQDGTLRFHGRPVQHGDAVTLDFGTVTVTGTVTGLAVEE